MTVDLSALDKAQRLLFAIPLAPLQGQRFQPTGFPGLGASTFRSPAGDCLLVESAQSMANRLEATLWDEGHNDLISVAQGISHIRVTRPDGSFLTDTILESHRLNSPYLLAGADKSFLNRLKEELGGLAVGPVDRAKFATTLFKLDIGSLLHGVFLARKELVGGRLRLARALSAFIEADGVRVAASGGVKNDHVNPSGDTRTGFGNVPFARDEFTADRITLYANIDLGQIRGYGLSVAATRLLLLLGLFKLRTLVDGGLRLRTACDLGLAADAISATDLSNFGLPNAQMLADDLRLAIQKCAPMMQSTTVVFGDVLKAVGSDDSGHDGATGEAGDAEG